MGASVHSAPYHTITGAVFCWLGIGIGGRGECEVYPSRKRKPKFITIISKWCLGLVMAVVSLNLTDHAYNAYKQIPRGSRSRVLSELIATRDLGVKMKGEGLLADLGYTTPREAILALTAMVEAQVKTIEQLQGAD